MPYDLILKEAILQSLATIVRIAKVMIPIMVVLEIARKFNWLEKLAAKIEPAIKILTLPPEAAFPLLAGLVFGLIYGAGLIIDFSRRGVLSKRDLTLIGVFLSINHALVEDTVIFAALGASPFILVFCRFLLAVVFTRTAAYLWDKYNLKSTEEGGKTPN